MKATLFRFLLFMILSAALSASVLQSGDYTYSSSGLSIAITGYTGPGGEIVIPSTIDGLPVTGIQNNAFNFCSRVTQVTIPDTVTSIGAYAFYYCSGLSSVKMPRNMTAIGDNAFARCTSLTSLIIPKGIAAIKSSTFSECDSLASVV